MQYHFGRWIDSDDPLTCAQAAELCTRAESLREPMASYPLDRVMALLARLRQRWLDPKDEVRRAALERLPAQTGFAPAMVSLGLDAVAWTLDPAILQRKIDTELGGIPRQDGYRYDPSSRGALRYTPLGTVLHVLAGNVFVGAVGSLVEGLLTGNVNVLKMPSTERVFTPLFMRSLVECDSDGVVSSATAVVDVPSAARDVVAELKRRVDAVVVWGGEEAVKGWRADLPARTRLIVFGPKLSIALVTRAGLEAYGVETVARRLAREVAVWDQNACTAPQACYVEGAEAARALARALGPALDSVGRDLPPGDLDRDQAVEIRKLRSIFEVSEARGLGLLLESARALDWTVVVDPDPELTPSPLGRTLRILPVAAAHEAIERIGLLRGYVQTAGLAAAPSEALALARSLAAQGALRVMDLGLMEGGEVDDPHDGAYDLPQLLNLVVTRVTLPSEEMDPIEALPLDERARLVDARLRRLVVTARRAPFYARRLAGISVDSTADLPGVPILTRDEMEENMPPRGEGLSTGPSWGGYVSRSGGSTGEPKFSIYDGPDWEELVASAVRAFHAMGLRRGDRLANMMLAGDLYGSFVSFDHINARIGVRTFAFADKCTPEFFARVARGFGINAVQGIPSVLVPFLRRVEEIEPGLRLEKVVYAGSPMSTADRQWLQSALGVGRIASVIGANDGGAIAYQCSSMTGAMHHVLDDSNLVEIVDGEGRPVQDGEPGRILITTLTKLAYPLIRYDISDAGRIVPGPCPCGRTARRLEYLGRSVEMVCVGLMNASLADLRRALEGTAVSQLQLVVRTAPEGESILVRVETGERAADLADRLRRTLLDRVEALAKGLADGSLASLAVEVLEPGALPRNPQSGKVLSIVDERR